MRHLKALTLALVVGVTASAEDNPDPTRFNESRFIYKYPQSFRQAVNAAFIDAGSLAINGVSFTAPTPFACDLDFPSIPAGYPKQNPNPCAATGVALGAACVVGVTAATPADAGSAWYRGTVINAYGRGANTVEIDILNLNGDGGAVDPPDASYRGFCF